MPNSSQQAESSSPNFFAFLLQCSRAGDYLMLLLFVVLAVASPMFAGLLSSAIDLESATSVDVVVNNRLVETLDLHQSGQHTFEGAIGEVVLQVENGSIRVIASECPNKICIRQGKIHKPNQAIVCVPNRLVAMLNGRTNSDVDAITY